MIHGDISPENILITQDGEIKLIDFGAARSFRQGSDNKERKIYLKPNYAPYEQYTQKPCQGPWTDIYALAATFYFIVSGRKMLDALSRAKGASYPPLHELCPAVSRQLSDVIDKATTTTVIAGCLIFWMHWNRSSGRRTTTSIWGH